MWQTLLTHFCMFTVILSPIRGHIPAYAPTPSDRISQYCELSETCVHDTIPICGKNGEQKRTFLDSCDLLEYACDTGEVFLHIDDEVGCPKRIRP